MPNRLSVYLLLLTASLFACGEDPGVTPIESSGQSGDPWFNDIEGASYALTVDEVSLSGAINEQRISALPVGEAYQDSGLSTVISRVDGETPQTSFMTLVYFEGGLNHPSVEVGAVFEHTVNPTFAGDELHVLVVGCQGLVADAVFDFDAPAEEATVEIGPLSNDNQVELIYNARFRSAEGNLESVSGRALVERPKS
ncbi:MAG: hypothetical protein AAFY60_10310 [Myxococcota bacterium]